MKNFKTIIASCALAGTLLVGCNNFLDINPAGETPEDKIFQDVQGYRDAMYAIYANLGTTDLYGKNLTYGFADQLGQLFTPSDINNKESIGYKTLAYEYTDPAIEGMISSIWSNMYKVISYINNVLEHIEDEDLAKAPDYRMIKGEAHALRAFLHFDLMRYFCEHIATDPQAGGIPYAYTFDLQNKQLFTLEECYGNVLEDLTKAQHLLGRDSVNTGYHGMDYNYVTQTAVHAMKARVFHYHGDLLDSAGYYAGKVIADTIFRLIESTTELPKVQKYNGGSEMIWGVYNTKLYDVLFQEFSGDPSTNMELMRPRKNVKELYQDTPLSELNHDYRWENFFSQDARGNIFTRLLKVDWEDPEDVEEQKEATKGICMLRLPEMYYIAAEAAYNSDRAKALEYLEAVRKSRGLGLPLNSSETDSFDKFKAALQKERIKELWGEGQVFLEYKRTNAVFMDADNEEEIVLTPEIRVFPWPRNEQEFGATNK